MDWRERRGGRRRGGRRGGGVERGGGRRGDGLDNETNVHTMYVQFLLTFFSESQDAP